MTRINILHGKRLLNFLKEKLQKHPDVVGITISRKITGDRETRNECITIFVKQKKTLEELSARRRLPRYFNQRHKDSTVNRKKRICTDIVQIGEVKALAAGGSGIIVLGENGTITMAFNYSNSDYILSNRHVLAPTKNAQNLKVKVRTDSGLIDIASLDTYFKIIDENGTDFLDAALAKVVSTNEDFVQIHKIIEADSTVEINRTRALKSRENGSFIISGSRSLVRSGSLFDIQEGGGVWKVDYDHLGTFFVDRLYALKVSASKGDSGSPVYEKDRNGTISLVGIVVAIATDDISGVNLTLFHSIKDIENGFKKIIGKPEFSFI